MGWKKGLPRALWGARLAGAESSFGESNISVTDMLYQILIASVLAQGIKTSMTQKGSERKWFEVDGSKETTTYCNWTVKKEIRWCSGLIFKRQGNFQELKEDLNRWIGRAHPVPEEINPKWSSWSHILRKVLDFKEKKKKRIFKDSLQKDWIMSKAKKKLTIVTFLKWHAKQGHSGAGFYREWQPRIYTQPSSSSDTKLFFR